MYKYRNHASYHPCIIPYTYGHRSRYKCPFLPCCFLATRLHICVHLTRSRFQCRKFCSHANLLGIDYRRSTCTNLFRACARMRNHLHTSTYLSMFPHLYRAVDRLSINLGIELHWRAYRHPYRLLCHLPRIHHKRRHLHEQTYPFHELYFHSIHQCI